MKPKARAVKSTGNIQGVFIAVIWLYILMFFFVWPDADFHSKLKP